MGVRPFRVLQRHHPPFHPSKEEEKKHSTFFLLNKGMVEVKSRVLIPMPNYGAL